MNCYYCGEPASHKNGDSVAVCARHGRSTPVSQPKPDEVEIYRKRQYETDKAGVEISNIVWYANGKPIEGNSFTPVEHKGSQTGVYNICWARPLPPMPALPGLYLTLDYGA